jgi:hypothetical protein
VFTPRPLLPFGKRGAQVSGYIRALRTLDGLELLAGPNPWKLFLVVIAEASGFTGVPTMRRAVHATTEVSLRDAQASPEGLQSATSALRKLIALAAGERDTGAEHLAAGEGALSR